jgi:hypothetical protein
MRMFNSSRSIGVRQFAPEFQLALACAHWPLSASNKEEICRLANEPLNWEWFKRIVGRNQILSLAYHNLCDSLPRDCFHQILEALRGEAIICTRQSLSQASELARISESIRGAGIEVVALKGVSLSVLAYGNLALRSPGDIDLLVSEGSVFEAERILQGLGYSRFDPSAELTPKRLRHYIRYHKHFTYVSETKAAPVELHWRLFDNIPLLKEADAILPTTVSVQVGSSLVLTLSLSELFLFLCVHGAVHGWPILKWLADIGALLRTMTEDDISDVAELAQRRGVMAELRAALTLLDLFLGVEAFSVVLSPEASPVAERIVKMGQRLLTAQDHCLEIHRLPRLAMFLYDLRLRSSWRYRSEDIRRALVHPPDWDRLNLPDFLFPLYLAVRPVSWVLRHPPRLSGRRSATVTQPAHPPSDSTVVRRNLDG